eukprot:CAMPEP_0171613432 /NCGR_PEP_ID=MMETSP0990-20121206/11768_1 /TAXON_ID=483369 /ORGANISM="non described non described, Strain CCMP2098" /LENGTH=112 /DNA_ID=CAMNT_0012177285 /DNA_START=777 /DNA_END=1115 /DNA_ORIENTATION=-
MSLYESPSGVNVFTPPSEESEKSSSSFNRPTASHSSIVLQLPRSDLMLPFGGGVDPFTRAWTGMPKPKIEGRPTVRNPRRAENRGGVGTNASAPANRIAKASCVLISSLAYL